MKSWKSTALHELHNQGYTWKEVGAIFGKSEPTMYRWIKKNDKEPQKRGRKPIVNDRVINLVRSYTLENKTKTQNEIAEHIYKELRIRISQPSICVLLKKLEITYKKLTYHYTKLNEEKAKAFNEEIKPLLNELPIMALDECSFYPNQDPRFSYSLKGERAVEKKPGHKGKHYTLLFAISNSKKNGVVHCKLIKGGANWKEFYDFLEVINPIGDKRNILLMDNARSHTAPKKRMKAKLPSTEEQMLKKNIEVKFITAYAPMINPTELVFNLFRQQSEKQRPRNFEEMELAIKKAVELLNTKNLSRCFWHCATYFDKKDAKIKLRKTITNF
jgi:transposase